MQTTHQIALETKHATLDKRLAEEIHRPHPDAIVRGGPEETEIAEAEGRDYAQI